MVRIHEIKVKAGESLRSLHTRIEKKLGLPQNSVTYLRIVKESLDAREKPVIYRVFSVDFEAPLSDDQLLNIGARKKLKMGKSEEYSYTFRPVEREFKGRPVVCGFGPCGMFAALTLAQYGLKPLVIERGAAMEKRVAAVEKFWSTGQLDPVSNVQFGEGGAGTFSDGKLTTGTKDSAQGFVLQSFVDAGASPEILYKQKPHIGTDVLRTVVVNIRKKIIELGGEFLFETCLNSVELENGRVCGVKIGDDNRFIETDTVIMALGHSARDTVIMLHEKGLLMEQKPFSMGVRIEHPQTMVDYSQYACSREELNLPPAEYKLNCKAGDNRGVYTFCMCPGGYVVAAASAPGHLVTNGMSNSDRSAENANSALLVDVRPEDYPSSHPLAGMYFQEEWERKAFELGGGDYKAPAQTVGSFLKGTEDKELKPLAAPTYKPGVRPADLHQCLPDFVSKSIEEALPILDRKLKGFADPASVMTGIESRSSAPYRIKRDATGNALASDNTIIYGLFPAGEGAGYAGGIMSAAVDGVKMAQSAVAKRD